MVELLEVAGPVEHDRMASRERRMKGGLDG
jgi:hypothetical protein